MGINWQANGNMAKAWGTALNPGDFTDLKALLLAFDASLIPGSIGTIVSTGNWRIDRQSPSSTAYNIQIQRNGVSNPSTVAAVLVPFAISNIGTGPVASSRKEALRYAFHGACMTSVATIGPKLTATGAVATGHGNELKVQILVGAYNQ